MKHNLTLLLNKEEIDTLASKLQSSNFAFSHPLYTHWRAKSEGITCTAYLSGKITIQGKNAHLLNYLLPTKHLVQEHIGSDESGKGDLFGPLCIAALHATKRDIATLSHLGVRDNKEISDKEVLSLGSAIERSYNYEVLVLDCPTYNHLYSKFNNLNHLLAWGHLRVLHSLIERSGCAQVITDRFASSQPISKGLQGIAVVEERPRGEEDVVVAGAAILARTAYLKGLTELSVRYSRSLPKGAGNNVKLAYQELVEKHGKSITNSIAKEHFKTTKEI